MENIDIKMIATNGTDGLHKSAIIYRDDSARFIYVCFHCSSMFNEINETLQHIESHFQLANVVLDPFAEDSKEENFADSFAVTSATEHVNVKIEMLDENEIDENPEETRSEPKMDKVGGDEFCCKVCNSIQESRFSLCTHVLNTHIQEPMKCCFCSYSFKTSGGFEKHLKMHMHKRDVSWKSIIDGIKTSTKVNWSKYELPAKSKKIAPTEDLSTVNSSRNTSASVHPYRCHKCPLAYRNATALKSHMKSHTDEELLQICRCKECNCYYKNAYALRVHVLEDHLKVKKFSCKACSVQFNLWKKKQFEEHLHQHNGSDNKLWSDIKDGIRHRCGDFNKYEDTYSVTENQYACEFCTQKFYIKCNLDEHINTVHSNQRRLQCAECFSIFATPKYYYAHQLEHQRVGPIVTERDGNVLLAKLEAVIDERIVYNGDEFSQQPFRCIICNASYDLHHDIRSHVRRHHVYKMLKPPMEPKKEFICDMCGMLLKSKHAIMKHLQIHTNIKSYPCKFCGKFFRLGSTRTIHERQHTGEKPYQCHECGKAYISKGLLTAHKKTHEDTTYSCHICGKIFNLPTGYRNHIKTHREDRPFKCTVCEKTFNTRIYLTRHMVIHSDKKYQCRFCDSKFNTGDGRRQHQRHKHKLELTLPK